MKGICHNCQIKKGIFVGSFNPPTKAHFQIGHYLYNNHYLDEIIYVPVNSIKKNNINITDRVNMINLYIKDYPYLKINNIEVINGNKNFSYKDMNILKEEYKSDLYIIMGADNFNDLINYDNYEYLLKNYYFMIINRNNINIEEIINNHYLKYKNKFTIINFNNDISSTKARNNINENYLDKKIIDYIKSNDLYSK